MVNLTISSMVTIVYCLTNVFTFNAYAFSNEMKNYHFRLIKNDVNFYSDRNPVAKYDNSILDTNYNIEGNDENFSRSHKEVFGNVQNKSSIDGYLRAAIETTALFGFVSLYYWGTKSSKSDFDYDVSFQTLRKKFSGQAVLFDDNSIGTNSFPGHPLSGSYYYLIARDSKLSRLESFLWSFAASSVHEFFIELPEVVSINDLVVTPVAGAAIGESMYQFGRYFRCSKNKNDLMYKIIAAVMDPIALVNSFFFNDMYNQFSQENSCYYNSFQKDFSISHGMNMNYHENTHDLDIGFILGFHGKLYLLPGYGQEADMDGFFNNTVLTETGLEFSITDARVDKLRFLAKTVWAAYWRQRVIGDPAGQITGYSFFAGLASAFEHIQYETGEFEDWIGAVHVLGPVLELTFFHQNGYLRISLDTFGDFAMVRPFAFERYKKSHAINNVKSILREEDYYYAFGVQVNPKIEAQYGAYRLLAEYKYAYYDSFEGADRRKPSNDFHLADTRQEYGVRLGRQLDFLETKFLQLHPISVEAEARRIVRAGFIADDQVAHAGSTTWLLLRFRMSL